MKRHWILGCILLIALALRLYRLGEVPWGLHADEASFVINTVSIMETLRDEDGRLLPIYLHSIKDPKPSLFSYLQIPGFLIFGPTAAASRLPSAVMGVVSIYLTYLLVQEVTTNRRWALLTASVLVISPWHIMNSRSTQEVIMSYTFSLGALLAFASLYQEVFIARRSFILRQHGSRLLLFSLLAFLAMYSYHSAKIFLLLIVGLVLAVTIFNKLEKKHLRHSLLFLAAVVIPFVLTASSAVVRFEAVGILNDDLPIALIHDYTSRVTGKTPGFLIRVFFNKPVFYTRHFLQQYLDHFSGSFFFLNGGKTGRHLIPSVGVMHIIEILPALAGLYYFAMYSRLKRLLPLWFLVLAVSPVAAAMTLEDIPSTTRAFFMVLPLAFLAAVGTEWIFSKCRRGSSTLILVFLLGYIWSLAFFTHQFFTVMPVWQPWHRSRDYEIAARIISDNQHLFDEVIISNDLREMYIYLWMNGKISLPQLKEQPLARYQEKYTLGKYSFNRGHCDFSAADGEVLMVGSLECAKKAPKGNYFVLEPSRFDDGVPAFAMMTNAEATLSGKLNHLMPPSTIPHEPE